MGCNVSAAGVEYEHNDDLLKKWKFKLLNACDMIASALRVCDVIEVEGISQRKFSKFAEFFAILYT